MNLTERLSALSAEINEQRTQIRILEEQVSFQAEVADDARIRALVAETPLAESEARIAAEDLRRLERSRDEALARLAALRAEQDALLERLLARAADEGR